MTVRACFCSAWHRASDGLVPPRQFCRGSGVLAGRSYQFSGVGSSTLFPPVEGDIQGRRRWAEKPEGWRRRGRAGRQSGQLKARAPVNAGGRRGRSARGSQEGPGGGVLGRLQEEGALEPSRRRMRAGPRWRGRGEGLDAKGWGEAKRGRACGVGKAGARRWRERPRSPPVSHSPSTSHRLGLRRGAVCQFPEPPCSRRLLPPLW